MIVGITGFRSEKPYRGETLESVTANLIRERDLESLLLPVISRFCWNDPTVEFVHGGCEGIDHVAGLVALWSFSHPVHSILPFDRSRVPSNWELACTSYEELPEGTTYRDRNIEIVKKCDRLIAFPRFLEDDPRSRRSGTWQTVRLARKAGKPVDIYPEKRSLHGERLAFDQP